VLVPAVAALEIMPAGPVVPAPVMKSDPYALVRAMAPALEAKLERSMPVSSISSEESGHLFGRPAKATPHAVAYGRGAT